MRSTFLASLAAMVCLPFAAAWAGRPLSTEDASVNDPAQCEVEAWVDRSEQVQHAHIAPACGVIDGWELGLEWDIPTPSDTDPQARALALKWAPDWLGGHGWHGWQLGAMFSALSERAPGARAHKLADWAVEGIATYPINAQWAVHLNLGYQKNKRQDAAAARTATSYGAAVSWASHERSFVFAEWNGDSRTPATRSLGLRWWLIQDRLGLDFTHHQTNATAGSSNWGIGLGWYGLQF